MGFPFGENRIAVHPEGRKPKLLGVKRDLDRVPPSWPSPRGASHRRARKRAFPARTGSATPVLRDGLRPPQNEGCWSMRHFSPKSENPQPACAPESPPQDEGCWSMRHFSPKSENPQPACAPESPPQDEGCWCE